MIESRKLYQWAFDNLEIKSIANADSSLGETSLRLAWGKKKLSLHPVRDCRVMLPKDVLPSSLNCKLDVPDKINAPVTNDQILGKATLSYANCPVAVVGLTSGEDIKCSNILYVMYVLTSFFESVWFKLALVFFFILLIMMVNFFVKKGRFRSTGRRGRRPTFYKKKGNLHV